MAARRFADGGRWLLMSLLAAPMAVFQIGDAGGQESGATPTATSPVPATTITLGEVIIIDGAGAAISPAGVAISAGGTYRISGLLADGMIEVDTPGEAVEIVLAGVTICNLDGPAIRIDEAESATVTLEAGTANLLADGGDTDHDAALSSEASLFIQGDGELTVEGNQKEGIASAMHITIDSGRIMVQAVEDGLNANNDDVSEITVNGGELSVQTETGDGIDSNGSITITGGTIISLGAMDDRNGGLDADGPVTIDGGTVVATGARLSLPDAASAQPSLMADFGATQDAGTLVVIQDGAGKDILVFAPANDFRRILYSHAGIEDGQTYTVFTGGTASGQAVDGRFDAPVLDPGTEVMTITTDSAQEAER